MEIKLQKEHFSLFQSWLCLSFNDISFIPGYIKFHCSLLHCVSLLQVEWVSCCGGENWNFPPLYLCLEFVWVLSLCLGKFSQNRNSAAAVQCRGTSWDFRIQRMGVSSSHNIYCAMICVFHEVLLRYIIQNS